MEHIIPYNNIAYLIFISTCIFITIVVGKSLHSNGKVFLNTLFSDESEIMLTINDVLLIGYYLLNIGFALFKIRNWETITSLDELIYGISYHLSIILLLLAGIHFCNLIAFYITAKVKNKFI